MCSPVERHQCAQKYQLHRQASHSLSAAQHHAVAPNAPTYSAGISACEVGQQHQQALQIFRAMQRHAIVPNRIIYGVAASVCEKRQQRQQAYIAHERCRACHRVGGGHLHCRHQCARKRPVVPACLTIFTCVRRHAIVPSVATYNAAISARRNGQQPQQALHLRGVPAGAMCPHTVQRGGLTKTCTQY